METIASRKNPLVLQMRRVAQGDADERGRLLLDGIHLLQEARTAGLPLAVAAFSTKLLNADDGQARRLATTLAGLGCRVVQVSDPVMEAMSPVSTPYELTSLLPPAPLDLPLGGTDPFLIVAVGVQDPGNLGAIVRVAEAGGATAVIAAGTSADPYGWKALRGSMGSALRLPLVRETDVGGLLEALRVAGVRILATSPDATGGAGAARAAARGGYAFSDHPLTGACACLLGGEGAGLTDDLLRSADGLITIPMQPPVESLNVAVSAALIVYEARRQRIMKT
jgi:RNA methyltransferase, TrmH family